jgi:hypothetical protein
MTNPENGPVYQVKLSKKIIKVIKELHKQAAQQGQGQRYLASLEAVHHRLQKDPRNFGEPLYRLPALRLLVYQAIVSPVVVHYGVHEEKPLVFLKWVQLLT